MPSPAAPPPCPLRDPDATSTACTPRRTSAPAGQPPTCSGTPSSPTRRAARCRPASSPAAPRPRTTAAVDHVLASTQVPAATVTERHTGSTGWHVAGSRMWCSSRPSRCHCRDARAGGGERPARRQGDQGRGVVGLVADQRPASLRPARHRPWRCPRRGRRAPRSPAGSATTRAQRSAAQALAVAAEVQPDVGRDADHPAGGVELDPLPAGRRTPYEADAVAAPGRLGDLGKVAVVAQGRERIPQRGVDRTGGGARRGEGDLQHLGQDVADPGGAAPAHRQAAQLGVRAEPARRELHAGQLTVDEALGGGQVVRVGDGKAHGGGPERPLVRRPPQRQVAQAGGGHHDPPDCAWGAPPAIPGCTGEPDATEGLDAAEAGAGGRRRRSGTGRTVRRVGQTGHRPGRRHTDPGENGGGLPGTVRAACACTVHEGTSWGLLDLQTRQPRCGGPVPALSPC